MSKTSLLLLQIFKLKCKVHSSTCVRIHVSALTKCTNCTCAGIQRWGKLTLWCWFQGRCHWFFLQRRLVCRCVLDYFERDTKDNRWHSAFEYMCTKVHVCSLKCLLQKILLLKILCIQVYAWGAGTFFSTNYIIINIQASYFQDLLFDINAAFWAISTPLYVNREKLPCEGWSRAEYRRAMTAAAVKR